MSVERPESISAIVAAGADGTLRRAASMTFTILFPTTGPLYPSGFGSRVRVHCDLVTSTLDTCRARLLLNGYTDIFATAVSYFSSATSKNADLYWGWDQFAGRPSAIGLPGPAAGYLPTALTGCDMELTALNSSFAVIDGPTLFTNPFTLDPITQGPWAVLTRLWDQAESQYNSLLSAVLGPTGLAYRVPLVGQVGSGTISLAGARGLRVRPTTIPGGWGFTSDAPPRYIPTLGAVQFANGPANFDWHQVHYADNLCERDTTYCNVVRWSLKPGVVADLTLYDAV